MPLLRRSGLQAGQMNNFTSAGPSNATQKIRLRRVPSTKQQQINENLLRMQENASKKQIAQDLYYKRKGGAVGRSPLKRQPNMGNMANNRLPVKNRLGNTDARKKGFVNNRIIPQRRNHQNPGIQNRNTVIYNRNKKFINRQSVQQRLLNIRNSVSNNTYQGPQKITLRRQRQQPVNYTVQVRNANQRIKKKSTMLDAKLQAEIKAIQSRSPALELVETPVVQAAYGCTTITLNDRFTQLM